MTGKPEANSIRLSKTKIRRRIFGTVLLLSSPFLFSVTLRDTWCDFWGWERSWVKKSSPLHPHVRDLWRDWDSEDIAEHPAAREIAAIILKEIPEGAGLEVIAEHINHHYKDAELEHEGMFKNSYFENAYGVQNTMLKISFTFTDPYNPGDPGFRHATIKMDRGKGSYQFFRITPGIQKPEWIDVDKQQRPSDDRQRTQ